MSEFKNGIELPLSNLTATTTPGVNNDDTEGYSEGSKWINITTDKSFLCLDASTGAAVWKENINVDSNVNGGAFS